MKKIIVKKSIVLISSILLVTLLVFNISYNKSTYSKSTTLDELIISAQAEGDVYCPAAGSGCKVTFNGQQTEVRGYKD